MPLDKPSSPSLAHLSVIDLHAQLAPIAFSKGRKAIFTNWASTFSSQTTATFRPRNVEEVRMVVELARREGKELRASGSGHSPSDLVCTDGYIINVDAMDQLLDVSQGGSILQRNQQRGRTRAMGRACDRPAWSCIVEQEQLRDLFTVLCSLHMSLYKLTITLQTVSPTTSH